MKTKFALLIMSLILAALIVGESLSEADITVLKSVSVGDSEGLPKKSVLTVTVQNGTALTGTYQAGTNNLSFSQYLEVKYSCTLDNYQAIIISTDNSIASAVPRYTGTGSGAGLVLATSTATNAALHWVVFDSPVTGGYTFVPGSDPNAEPIKTSNQFFVADKKESPFPAGYASFIYDLDSFFSRLADAPNVGRTTNDGTVYVYLGANLKFMPSGTYKSSTFAIELVTINPNNTFVVHNRRVFTVTAAKA